MGYHTNLNSKVEERKIKTPHILEKQIHQLIVSCIHYNNIISELCIRGPKVSKSATLHCKIKPLVLSSGLFCFQGDMLQRDE